MTLRHKSRQRRAKDILFCLVLAGVAAQAGPQDIRLCQSVFVPTPPSGSVLTSWQASPPQGRAWLENFMLAPFSYIYDLVPSPKRAGKMAYKKKDPQLFDWVRQRSLQTLRELDGVEVNAYTRFIVDRIFQPRHLGNDSVLVSIDIFKTLPQLPIPPELALAIGNRIAVLYWNTAMWVYFLEGLDPYNSETLMRNRDEYYEYLRQGQGFKMFMLFDSKVWEVQEKLIQRRIHQYVFQPDYRQQIVMNGAIQEDFMAPYAGIMITDPLPQLGASGPHEIKRYFSNESEDPLEIFQLHEKPESRRRLQMIQAMYATLWPSAQLELHAHTKLHVKAYEKLGFIAEDPTSSPLFPLDQYWPMHSSVSTSGRKISEILKNTQ